MADFETVEGFEDLWRPVALPRRHPQVVLGKAAPDVADRGEDASPKARLARLTRRAPEVMVKVTGRTRCPCHLRAHLDYISRNGALTAEDRDGCALVGKGEIRQLAADWGDWALADPRRRTDSPVSLSLVLSMPADTPPDRLRDAVRAFASDTFADQFDYVFVLHTDVGHPHVHLTVRALGEDGRRLNPKKADLEAWRQAFARALRDRGVEAEATPRRARGQVRRAEPMAIRKIRERYEAGQGALPRVLASAAREAIDPASTGATRPWEAAIARRQARIRGLYADQARLFLNAADPELRELGQAVARFLAEMPAVETRGLALTRQLHAARRQVERSASSVEGVALERSSTARRLDQPKR